MGPHGLGRTCFLRLTAYGVLMKAKPLKASPQQAADGSVVASPTKVKAPAADVAANQQTDEILNSILPPR